MSRLIAWWPLTGNLNDYSGNNKNLTGTAIVDNSGKVGKCYSFYSSSNLVSNNITIKDTVSISAWAYCTDSSKSQMLFSLDSPSFSGVDLYLSGNTFSWNKGDGANNPFKNNNINVSIPELNKWHHFCIINSKSKNKCIMYLNGNYYGEAKYVDSSQIDRRFIIGNYSYSNTYSWNGKINDVRVFDGELSLKEIKEISKAKILHYTFNENCEAYQNLAKNKTYTIYNNYSEPATLTKTGERFMNCDVYRLKFTVTDETKLSNFQTSLSSHGIYGFRETFKANTKYCFWIYYKNISHQDTRVGGTASNISGWTEIPPKKVYSGWNVVGQYRNGLVTTDKIDNIFTSFRCPTLQLNEEIIIDFACPNLVEGKDYIIENLDYQNTETQLIRDSSGFRNDSLPLDPITCPKWVNDSKMGSGCYSFDGNNSINCNQLFFDNINQEWTVTGWAKLNVNDITQNINNFNLSNRLTYSTTKKALLYLNDGTEDSYVYSNTTIPINEWYHFAFVVNTSDLTCKYYHNGILNASSSNYSSTDFPQGFPSTTIFGQGLNGYLDDIRIYATSLNDEDIKNLYQSKGSISKNGELFINEIIENENILNAKVILDRQNQLGINSTSKLMIKDNINSLALSASSFYKAGEYHSIFPDNYFKPNTSYEFCITINSNVENQGVEVPGGLIIVYDNDERDNTFVVKTSGKWKQLYFKNDPIKSIKKVLVYYYAGQLFYIDLNNSYIKEFSNASINKKGQLHASEVCNSYYNTSLIDYTSWTLTSAPGWDLNGSSSENGRTIYGNPRNELDIVWYSPENDIDSGPDGGFLSPKVVIDKDKKYRFSIWLRRELCGTGSGTSYFGLYGYNSSGSNTGVITLTDTISTNPYFTSFSYTSFSSAVNDKWALLVAYVHPNSSTITITDPTSGIYNLDGVKLGTFTNFKWNSDTTQASIRSYLYYSTKVDEKQYFYRPRIDLCDGNEPSINDLLKCQEHMPLVNPNGIYFSKNIFSINKTNKVYVTDIIHN